MLRLAALALVLTLVPTLTRAETSSPPECREKIDAAIRAIFDSDGHAILAQQLQLTTLKLALEAKKADRKTVEAYLKTEFDRLDRLDSARVREKLVKLYGSEQLPIDVIALAARLKDANYFKRPLRFKNDELSFYVLAHQEIEGEKSVYNRLDAAILWYQARLAEKSDARPGSVEANLLEGSTLAARYLGFMKDVKTWSVEEIEKQVAYGKQAMTNAFQTLSEKLVVQVDPACRTAASCPDCAASPESLERDFADWMQSNERVIGPVKTKAAPTRTKTQVALQQRLTPIETSETLKEVTLETSSVSNSSKASNSTLNPSGTLESKIETETKTPAIDEKSRPASSTTKTETPPTSYPLWNAVFPKIAARAEPQAPLSPNLFRKAYEGWLKIKRADPATGDQVIVIDYDQPATSPRLYMINCATGELVAQVHTSHAGNSDRVADGIPDHFSNVKESKETSLGFFKVADARHKSASWGDAFLLEGIDGKLNSNAKDRFIKFHGIPDAARTTSYGCFMVSNAVSMSQYPRFSQDAKTSVLDFIRNRTHDGDLVFAYSSKANQEAQSDWI